MIKRSTTAGAACFVAAASLASAAHAGDVLCLWNGLPHAYGDALRAFGDDGGRAFVSLAKSDQVFLQVMAACGVKSQAQFEAAVHALEAYGMEEASARALNDRYQLTRAQVDAAWLALPAARRDAFSKSLTSGLEDDLRKSERQKSKLRPRVFNLEARAAGLPLLHAVGDALGVTNEKALNEIGDYLTMKVIRTAYEAKF